MPGKVDGRLPRADRLTGDEFVLAVRRPAAATTPALRVHVRANGLGRSRIGVSVGRRFGKAVARNRLKRLVREAFRTSPEARAAGLDIVVVAGARVKARGGKPAGARAAGGRAGARPAGDAQEVLERPGEIARALALAVSRGEPRGRRRRTT